MRALSIQQPWVDRILSGEKNIKYRSRRIKDMGPLLLHASKTVVPENFDGMEQADADRLPYGALVGVVDVVDVVPVEGEDLYEWRLAHPRRFAMPIPYKGAASIFKVPMADIKMYLRPLLV
ncbi:ASCH domain-containing protein [Deinococcus sp. KNUC1210]|uniref:ASCH domain-containing protein n=1 Tax=Deinococcus sp. KNUC1210 TaxID=2917691 RepID=UPI001EF09FBA|nr:ASCH domain-containing protein [Deinococcus sp. KNUC1210]ULH16665.1 ASCH domain-containing protein [Deinococcus sp. KNUC1210]